MNRKLSPAERAQLVEQYRAGASALGLARHFNVHRQTVARQLKREGIELRGQLKRTPELTEQAKKLYGARAAKIFHSPKLPSSFASKQALSAAALKKAGVNLRPPVANRWRPSDGE